MSARHLASCSAGNCARLLRLAQQCRGAIEVAVGERPGDLGAGEPRCSKLADARILGVAALKLASVLRRLIEARGAQRLVEAAGEHPATRCRPSRASPLLGVGGGRGTVIEQRIVAGRLGEAALVHGEARLFQQLVDLALHDG